MSALPDYSPARVLLRAGRQRPNRPSIIWEDDSVWTVSQSADAVRRTAAHLRSLGIGEGDRVVLATANTAWCYLLHCACSWLKAVTVPLSERLPDDVSASLIEMLSPALVIVDEGRTLRHGARGGVELPAFSRAALAHAPISTDPPRCADEVAAIVFTSGSAGRTRGVRLTHSQMWWGSMCFRDGFEYSPARDVLGVCAPISHIGGFNGTSLDVFSHGGTIIVFRQFDPERILRAIERHRITMMFVVPTMCHLLLDVNERVGADLSSWARPLVGGDAMGPSLKERLNRAGLRPIHVWGMTETSGAGLMTSPDADAPDDALGAPFPYVDVRLVLEDSSPAPVGSVGEIEVRGPGVSSSFITAGERGPARVRDGWLRTGDLARVDETGWFHLVGRASRLINTGGELVAPGRIEEALRSLDEVADACVVGVPDERWGEKVCAVLVGANEAGRALDSARLRELMGARLAPWEQVRAVSVVDSLPTLANGKPDFQAAKTLFAEDLGG